MMLLESVVNLVAASVAVWAISYAARPADDTHAFGHSKAEYFSSGVEGALILVAAVSIAIAAWERLSHPQPLEQLGIGLGLTLMATVLNGALAFKMLQAGKRLRSITLRADAHHLLTDVWTSVGVLVGVMLVKLMGWLVLDSIIALVVAANIVWVGFKLLRETGTGLLDASLPEDEQHLITEIFLPEIISYCVWLYYTFPLSYRAIEKMMLYRGIEGLTKRFGNGVRNSGSSMPINFGANVRTLRISGISMKRW